MDTVWTPRLIYLTSIICSYVFLSQFTPIMPYYVPYLVQVKHLGIQQVTNQVLPVTSYSILLFTILLTPACKLLSYRGVVIIGAFSAMATQVTLLLGRTLFWIQMTMVSLASILPFLLPKDLPSQILEPLNRTSIPVPRSLRQSMFDLYKAYKENWRVVKEAWESKGLQVLTFWWSFTMAGFPMLANYSTSLFAAIDSVSTYNGHVIAATQAIACLASLIAVPLSRIADQTGGLGYFLGSILVGILCMVMAYAKSIWIAYVAFVVSVGINDLLLCLLVVQCAKSISNGQYMLVFSFSTLGGLIMQAVFQAIIEMVGLNVFTQYFILGIHFFLLAFSFALICVAFYCKTGLVVLVPTETSLPTYGTFSVLEDSG